MNPSSALGRRPCHLGDRIVSISFWPSGGPSCYKARTMMNKATCYTMLIPKGNWAFWGAPPAALGIVPPAGA